MTSDDKLSRLWSFCEEQFAFTQRNPRRLSLEKLMPGGRLAVIDIADKSVDFLCLDAPSRGKFFEVNVHADQRYFPLQPSDPDEFAKWFLDKCIKKWQEEFSNG